MGVKRMVPRGMRLEVLGPLVSQTLRVSFHKVPMNTPKRASIRTTASTFPPIFLMLAGTREKASPNRKKAMITLALPRACGRGRNLPSFR